MYDLFPLTTTVLVQSTTCSPKFPHTPDLKFVFRSSSSGVSFEFTVVYHQPKCLISLVYTVRTFAVILVPQVNQSIANYITKLIIVIFLHSGLIVPYTVPSDQLISKLTIRSIPQAKCHSWKSSFKASRL